MTRYISVTDTAKLIRSALAEAFPSVKFGVRSKSYSMGASITVSWTDGPTESEVSAVTSKFAGATFDPTIDLKSYVYSEHGGERVHFGADYIFCTRSYSDYALITTLNTFREKYGISDGKFVPEQQTRSVTIGASVEFRDYRNQEVFYRLLSAASLLAGETDAAIKRDETELMLTNRDF